MLNNPYLHVTFRHEKQSSPEDKKATKVFGARDCTDQTNLAGKDERKVMQQKWGGIYCAKSMIPADNWQYIEG